MIGPIAHDRPLHDSKKWALLWKLGGDAHHYRFFLQLSEAATPAKTSNQPQPPTSSNPRNNRTHNQTKG
jgi:hypothetical protein